MAGNKPLSWKWRLVIAFVCLFLFSSGFVFSPWGNNVIVGWIKDIYQETPNEERRNHPAADYYLLLCWFQGTICGRSQHAMQMYDEFLGILPTKNGEFFATYQTYGPQWNGFFDGKDKTGWGPLHERAPEAFFEYLSLYSPLNTEQFVTLKAAQYYTLFYQMYPQLVQDGKYQPHPKFYKYWKKISDQMINRRFLTGINFEVGPKPPDFEGPID